MKNGKQTSVGPLCHPWDSHQRALCKVLDITQIDEVITDAGTAAAEVAKLEQQGLIVHVAPNDGVFVPAAVVPA